MIRLALAIALIAPGIAIAQQAPPPQPQPVGISDRALLEPARTTCSQLERAIDMRSEECGSMTLNDQAQLFFEQSDD